ncbi:MAG: NADH-quinone oxidoreductase subunit G, partial [Pseudorhodobacter sp.]
PWDNLAALRSRMIEVVPHFGAIDEVAENDWSRIPLRDPAKADFLPAVREFYLTNPIARASALMGELQAMAKARGEQPLAAE